MFYIDIGNIPPNEVDNFMQKVINKMKKVPFVDEKTGDYNLSLILQNMTEDFLCRFVVVIVVLVLKI